MQRAKGYILPIVLIVLLLIFAGFILFSQKTTESPSIPPAISDISTTTEDVNNIEEDVIEEDTATTSDTVDDIQATTSTANDLEE